MEILTPGKHTDCSAASQRYLCQCRPARSFGTAFGHTQNFDTMPAWIPKPKKFQSLVSVLSLQSQLAGSAGPTRNWDMTHQMDHGLQYASLSSFHLTNRLLSHPNFPKQVSYDVERGNTGGWREWGCAVGFIETFREQKRTFIIQNQSN